MFIVVSYMINYPGVYKDIYEVDVVSRNTREEYGVEVFRNTLLDAAGQVNTSHFLYTVVSWKW